MVEVDMLSRKQVCLAVFVAVIVSECPRAGYAQFRVGGALQNEIAFDAGARRGFNAGFNRGDMFGPYGGFYPGWGESPIGGYMRGYADVIGSLTQGMIDEQQSRMVREQVNQAKIETRRKQYDEWLYERNTRPTVEDDRERQRIENIRRARNDPPPNEIWSGQALNQLLGAIQQQESRNVRGPTIPVLPETARHINVSSGATTGSIGLLRDGGKLTWPAVLQRPVFDEPRKRLDDLAVRAYDQARSGPPPADTIDGMTEAVNQLSEEVSRQIANLTPTDFGRARSFLREIESTIRMLQDPNVANYVTRKWAVTGSTVGEVVDNMTSQGLKFGPASKGDEAAYNAMFRGLVAYLQWDPSHAWDTMTK
jgi:hypothetical protein